MAEPIRQSWRNIFESIEEPRTTDCAKSPEAQAALRDRISSTLLEFSHLHLESYEPRGVWSAQANCRGKSRFFFNPYLADDTELRRVEYNRDWRINQAKKICDGCPVRLECHSWSIRNGALEQDPILGRMTWSERKRWLRRLRTGIRSGQRLLRDQGVPLMEVTDEVSYPVSLRRTQRNRRSAANETRDHSERSSSLRRLAVV